MYTTLRERSECNKNVAGAVGTGTGGSHFNGSLTWAYNSEECPPSGRHHASFQFQRRTGPASWMTSDRWHSHHIWWRPWSDSSSTSSDPRYSTLRTAFSSPTRQRSVRRMPSSTFYIEPTRIWTREAAQSGPSSWTFRVPLIPSIPFYSRKN